MLAPVGRAQLDSNGTNFGFNPRTGNCAEAGHNDFYPVAVATAQQANLTGSQTLLAMICWMKFADAWRRSFAEVVQDRSRRGSVAPGSSTYCSLTSRSCASSTARRRSSDDLDAQIFFIARLPRVVAAALVGARWRPPASSSRRCFAIPWRRRIRLAYPGVWLSARCWQSRFICDFARRRHRLDSARELRRVVRRTRHRLRARPGVVAGSRPSCCCSQV